MEIVSGLFMIAKYSKWGGVNSKLDLNLQGKLLIGEHDSLAHFIAVLMVTKMLGTNLYLDHNIHSFKLGVLKNFLYKMT